MMNRIVAYLVMLSFFATGMAGCRLISSGIATPTSSPLEIATKPSPTETPILVEDNIRLALADQLGISADDVQMHAMEPVEWPNSCLGFPSEGEVCAEVITPGYGGILITDGVLYEFHSNESGSVVRFIPGAAIAARQILISQLGIDQGAVEITKVDAVTWQDDCLEIETEQETCQATEIPGYIVGLEAEGKSYEYHTDDSGGDVRLAVAPSVAEIESLISWSEITDDSCKQAEISSNQVMFGACGGAQMLVNLSSIERAQEIQQLAQKYAAFEAETQAGKVVFIGKGEVAATPADQRIVAEWAKVVMLEAMGGRGGASWGLAYAWHREGGIAGACEDVTVYLSGLATAASCKNTQPEDLGKVWLTGNQMWQLYSWIDTYKGFEYEYTDSDSADAMSERLIFSALGDQEAGEFERTRLMALAEEILGQVQTQPNQADMDTASDTLVAYLSALAVGDYTEAVELYGGSYQVLQDNNPLVAPEDYFTLFKQACTINGFICYLGVKNFVQQAQLSENEFRLTVELENPDGSLFLLGPCCGADPAVEPPWSQFDFLVEKVDGTFKIMDLPIYVP